MLATLEQADLELDGTRLRLLTVHSSALGRRADLTLCVPPAIDDLRDVPIITLLHGVRGSHWAWTLQGRAHLAWYGAIARGVLAPAVLAMPSDGLWGDGSGYLAHDDADYERWIVEDVPQAVWASVPSTSVDSAQCIAGLSMGGWGALRFAGKHPQRYRAAAGHSSITEQDDFRWFTNADRSRWSQAPADRSVYAALLAAGSRLPPVQFDCGSEDELRDANRALHAALDAAGVAHRYREYPGGHDWAYWSTALTRTLEFFGECLRAQPRLPGG